MPVCLWNDHFHVFISLIDSLLAYIYMLFLLIFCSWYVIGCLTRCHYFVWLWNDYHLTSNELMDSLFALLFKFYLFIWIIDASMCFCFCFYKKLLLCMILKLILFDIHFIDWFLTCLIFYTVSFRLSFCNRYVIGCLRKVIFLSWSRNGYYLILSSWIGSLFA